MQLQNQKIFLPDGSLIPISGLASVKLTSGDAELKARKSAITQGVVSARLEGSSIGTVIPAIQKGIAKNINLPQGYHIEYGGDYANQQQSFKELLLILVTSSLLVFAVILFLFKQFKIAFIIIAVAILGIAGSMLALFITGTPVKCRQLYRPYHDSRYYWRERNFYLFAVQAACCRKFA